MSLRRSQRSSNVLNRSTTGLSQASVESGLSLRSDQDLTGFSNPTTYRSREDSNSPPPQSPLASSRRTTPTLAAFPEDVSNRDRRTSSQKSRFRQQAASPAGQQAAQVETRSGKGSKTLPGKPSAAGEFSNPNTYRSSQRATTGGTTVALESGRSTPGPVTGAAEERGLRRKTSISSSTSSIASIASMKSTASSRRSDRTSRVQDTTSLKKAPSQAKKAAVPRFFPASSAASIVSTSDPHAGSASTSPTNLVARRGPLAPAHAQQIGFVALKRTTTATAAMETEANDELEHHQHHHSTISGKRVQSGKQTKGATHMRRIVRLQAVVRGKLARRKYNLRKYVRTRYLPQLAQTCSTVLFAVIFIQARIKGYLKRRKNTLDSWRKGFFAEGQLFLVREVYVHDEDKDIDFSHHD